MFFVESLWSYMLMSSAYLILGFLIAGLIHVYLPLRLVKKFLGKGKLSDAFWGALIGVPMPLCSCSVIPTTVMLKKAGASNSGSSAFLIATPESGLDSMAMTYSMMDFPMTIFRPIAAFISAFLAGVLNFFFNQDKVQVNGETPTADQLATDNNQSFIDKLKSVLKFSFKDLLDDMSLALLIGLICGALISVFFPDHFFEQIDPNISKLVVFLIGIPLYICASSATPIAAALVMKGMSPGTALIFLLAGPATNISNLFVMKNYIGLKGIFINIFSIVITSALAAYGVDWYYSWNPMLFKLNGMHDHFSYSWIEKICAVVFSFLILQSIYRKHILKYFMNNKIKKNDKPCCKHD